MEPLLSYKLLKSADFAKNIKEKQEEYQQEQRREACNETLTLRNATKDRLVKVLVQLGGCPVGASLSQP